MNRAVFFDRDGILNKLIFRDKGYFSPQFFKQFDITTKAIFVIKELKQQGFLSIVVSNQPDISRGKLSKLELDKMTKELVEKTSVDDVFYCFHDDHDNCFCRKPKPGLLISASKKWNINLNESFMVGDTWKDAEAAFNAKVEFFLLNKNYNSDYYSENRINDLEEIIKLIKG